MAAIAALIIAAVITIIIIAANAGVKDVSKLNAKATESSIELSWAGASKKLSYDIYQKGPDDSDYTLVSTVPGTSGSKYTASDLGSAEKYDFKVVSVKGEGKKAKKSEGALLSVYTTPKKIETATAVTQNKNSLTISFANVDDATDYELRFGESEELGEDPQVTFTADDLSINPNDNTKNYMVNGLTEGNTYYFSIRSSAGEDNYSEWSSVFSGKVTRAVDMTGVDVNRPMVALTFDDGPDASDITWRILDALEASGGKGTFFQLGQLAENMPDRMQRMVEGGHEIGSHTYDHEHMGNAVNENDIVHANDVIEQACGVRPTCFRSPGGETTDTIRQICVSEDMPLYYWTIDTRDWETRNADSVLREVQSTVSDGDIILLHNIYDSSAAATERIVPWLVDQGYQLVTVSQLVQAKTGQPPEPGVQYYSGDATN